MQINLDPTRWLVSFAGFVVDWMMTREWSKIALTSIPLMFLATVAGLVFWGSRLDKHQLATRYLELGEKEISDWEASWAPDRTVVEASKDSKLTPTKESGASESKESDAKSENPTSDAPKTEKKELSRFAEVLFRRVQLLEPNERSQFVIGVTMAQRGATGQAQKMLSKIAPDNRPGYAPAHAWIAQTLLRQPPTRENVKVVVHHVKEAAKWDRVPDSILLLGSQLLLTIGDKEGCLDMLKKAADLNPANSLFLVQYAKLIDNKVLIEYSTARAEKHFRGQLERDPYDLKARIGLIQTLAENAKLDEAEEVVRAGMQIEPSPELTRGLSEVYRLRYLTTLKQGPGDLQVLDTAMRIDPTNPMIGEEIAKLARLNGKSPGDDFIQKLQQFLAEGKATAATHAWIAELYLLREDYAKALPYLEQVVTRLPNSAQYLNNLAFVLDEIAPERRQEALKFAERAVQIEPRSERSPDYFDTLAKVLAGLDRRTEAIAAIQSAIERAPARKDFHESIIVLYEAAGNAEMAEQHRNVIKRIVEMEEKATAAAAAEAKAAEEEKAKESEPVKADTETQVNAAEGNAPEANAAESKTAEANAPEANAAEAPATDPM